MSPCSLHNVHRASYCTRQDSLLFTGLCLFASYITKKAVTSNATVGAALCSSIGHWLHWVMSMLLSCQRQGLISRVTLCERIVFVMCACVSLFSLVNCCFFERWLQRWYQLDVGQCLVLVLRPAVLILEKWFCFYHCINSVRWSDYMSACYKFPALPKIMKIGW